MKTCIPCNLYVCPLQLSSCNLCQTIYKESDNNDEDNVIKNEKDSHAQEEQCIAFKDCTVGCSFDRV